jgi:hypothetical protein
VWGEGGWRVEVCRVKVVRSVQCVLVCAVCWCVQCAGKRLLIRGSAPASASALAFAAAAGAGPCPALRLRRRATGVRLPRASPDLHFRTCTLRGLWSLRRTRAVREGGERGGARPSRDSSLR